VQVFFWGQILMLSALLLVSAGSLRSILNGEGSAALAVQASQDPASFRGVATQLNVHPTPNTGSVRTVEEALGALGIARFVLVALLVPFMLLALWLTATIITFFEICLGIIRNAGVLLLLLSIGTCRARDPHDWHSWKIAHAVARTKAPYCV
jgi:hypothetical protein